MKRHPALLLVLYASAASADGSAVHRLAVGANRTSVTVVPQSPDRHFFELPSLDIVFRIEASCHKDWQPESLSLNVADSLVTRNASELLHNSHQQIALRIPAEQLAPIAIRNFCVIDGAAEGSGEDAGPPAGGDSGNTLEMTVSAALSAHASLRCSNGDEQKIIYVTEPLDVTLVCEEPKDAGEVRQTVSAD
ncbi:MAG TPA: hypothetical protein VNQ14_16425 [Woeseiaceae bacterium]|nr:hypothetical protein [Woeseiaceae bacterium]